MTGQHNSIGAGSGVDGSADAVLLASAQRGDRGAIAQLLRPETDRVYAICLRMVGRDDAARDLAQDALVKVIRALPSFDGRSKLSTWITRIAMNTCLTWLRDEGRRADLTRKAARSGGLGPEVRGDGEPEPGSRVSVEEERGAVLGALSRVSAEHRSILVLRDVRGFEYDQIGEVLGISVGTVKSRLFRARKALRAEIEKAAENATAKAKSEAPRNG